MFASHSVVLQNRQRAALLKIYISPILSSETTWNFVSFSILGTGK